ncbi:MAG: DUF4349 domain-containing protein [Tannerellaceae bacterium]|jgi:hypothetical protein|nr:DUF4349 domain-containing protein [Tannerellaceae bacterium]
MMNGKNAIAIMAAIALALSCSQNRRAEIAIADEEAMELNESMKQAGSAQAPDAFTSAAAIVSADTTRKFVRTAGIKFRAADVLASTYDVEMIAVNQGGFVVSSQLNNRIDHVTTVDVGRDSCMETTCYTLESNIELRVPAANLDRTLREISLNVEQLDYRDIQADDVTLDFLRYSLARKREERSAARAAQAIARARSNPDDSSMTPEELARSSEERADEALLGGLRLADKVEFASISVHIFQRRQLKHEMFPKEQPAYRPGIAVKISEAFCDGLEMMESLLLFIVRLWVLIVGIAAGGLAWKYLRKLRSKS